MRNENIAIVQRYFAAWDACDLDALDDLIAPDVIEHSALEGQSAGVEGYKQFFVLWRTAFPDFHSTIDDQIVEGDKVVSRWTFHGTHRGDYHGIAPTGKTVTVSAISITRIAGGKIVEEWYIGDELGLLRQLGAIPVGGAGTI